MKGFKPLLVLLAACLIFQSSILTSYAAPNPVGTTAYPYGTSGCVPGNEVTCEYYYAETHFNAQVYWADAPPLANDKRIGDILGTYTMSTGNFDTWEVERVYVGTNKPPQLGGQYTQVYNSTQYDEDRRRESFSSHWVKYSTSSIVKDQNNSVIVYYEINTYTSNGSPRNSLYPKRAVFDIDF
ncbi:hypothetical protein M3223_02005 [Paenibacillus pasadenensis]|uniref:hypothetical protein n=1 Tax=Paenibacillus pasadenensis TaxID=217090 RepID=UPI00203A45E6|nr:hypothetical protein [Paenibacillus pasadenensis]MCM3746122.1 hypothetical protein [Paenibacillus pasadenensis]